MANPPSPPPPQPPDPITIDGAAEDSALSSSTYLTRLELVTWRSRRYKQLAQIYRTHYWTLMEELKVKHKEYCWKYGKSPYKEDEKNKKRKRDFNNDKEIFELNAKLGIRDGGGEAEDEERGEGGLRKCLAAGFNAKAMALTRFFNTHILLDSRQKLYKGCTFDIKSAQGRPVLCQKPVLISTVSSLCSMHFQKAERQVARALKKEGLSFSSPSKLASKLHVNLDVYALKLLMREKLVISLTGRSLDHWTYALEENSSCILKVLDVHNTYSSAMINSV
ncbi:hypothetical protein NC652_020805 [Populus alba x Populus x berolinensis]|nr:hypothetical protein NC652_020805 [Populus alba x Populus x berolinensis]